MPRFRSFHGIQDFSLYCNKFEPDSFTPGVSWDVIFQQWTVLTTLTLYEFPVEEVMLALTPSSNNLSTIVCPQLEFIHLYVSEANVAMFDILTDLFKLRELGGSRIGNLKMWLFPADLRTYGEEIKSLNNCVNNMEVVEILKRL